MITPFSVQLPSVAGQIFFKERERVEKGDFRLHLRYYNLLNGTRGKHPDWYSWIDFFLDACARMTDSLLEKLDGITELAEKGLQKISATTIINRVWLATFQMPYITVNAVVRQLGVASITARKALNELVALGMLDVDHSKTKNKVYVNYD